MRFLITHYEGIKSEHLKILVETLDREFGYCYLVLPNQVFLRGSHKVSEKVIPYEEIPPLYNSDQTIIVNGTPSDCIRVGKELFRDKIDLVITGISPQASLGYDNYYNANTQASIEANIIGYPSISIHSSAYNMTNLEESLIKVLNLVIKDELYKKYPLLNINIPQDPDGIKAAKLGKSLTYPIFNQEEDKAFLLKYSLTQPAEEISFDGAAFNNNKITITPLELLNTQSSSYDSLKKILDKNK